jgi:hypothetical protein
MNIVLLSPLRVLQIKHNLHEYILDHADNVYLILNEPPDSPVLEDKAVARFAGIYHISSYDSLEELSAIAADLLVRGARIDRCLSMMEFTQYATGYLEQLLGLSDQALPLVFRSRDKRVMKMAALEAGIPVARWYSLPAIGRDVDHHALEAAVGYPMVIKPVAGMGTIATKLVSDRQELDTLLNNYVRHPHFPSDHLMAEEYISGEEFYVEAVWRDGEPWIFSVARYIVPLLRGWLDDEMDCTILLEEADHPQLYRQLLELHKKWNQETGFTRGSTHMEVFRERGTGRILFSEVATRIGGANVPDIITARYGVYGGVISAGEFLGLAFNELPRSAPSPSKYLGGLCIVPRACGVITKIPDEEEMRADPAVIWAHNYKDTGDSIDNPRPSDWAALLVIKAESEQGIIDEARRLGSTFTFHVEASG